VKLQKGLEVGRELLKFIDWFNRQYKNKAYGLAAPQLGIDARVCVVNKTIFVNPRITSYSEAKISWEESCLSFPSLVLNTYRHIWVDVVCDNMPKVQTYGINIKSFTNKKPHEAIMEAVGLQHEIGHLAGLLIMDFVTQNSPDPVSWFDKG
jgi:peptide deformylase